MSAAPKQAKKKASIFIPPHHHTSFRLFSLMFV